MLYEIDSLTTLTPKICQIWVLGTPVVGLFTKVRLNRLMFIRSFTCPLWTRTVPCEKNYVILYGPCLLLSSFQYMTVIST